MRFIFIAFSIFIYNGIAAQDLNNTEWILIKAARKDGSRIIGSGVKETDNFQYYFTSDSVYIAANGQYSFHQKYSLYNNQLSIGSFVNYQIDSLNEIFLGVTEIPTSEKSDDKISSMVFIKSDFIYDYINKTNQFQLPADSIIENNHYFQPEYNGDIVNLFKNNSKNEEVSGCLIITGDGVIKNVEIQHASNTNEKEIKRVIDILKATSGHWIMPPSPKMFLFKSYFILKYSYVYNRGYLSSGVSFSFVSKDSVPAIKNLTLVQRKTANNNFNNGMRLLAKNKFDKAANAFTECI